jgi:hypothetical protein
LGEFSHVVSKSDLYSDGYFTRLLTGDFDGFSEEDAVNLSPTLRDLLRDILGNDPEPIPDEILQVVDLVTAEVSYLDAILGDASDSAMLQFDHYELN